MNDFLKKINNFLNINTEIYYFLSQIDGISATLVYEKGILIKGLSKRRYNRRYLRKFKNNKKYPKKN